MGVIQNAVNQMIGTATIAARLSPGLEEKAKTRSELRDLSKQENILKARRDAAVESVRTKQQEGTLQLEDMEKDVDVLQETAANVEYLRKRQFELKPSTSSYEKYIKSKDVVRAGQSLREDIQAALAKRQELAMQKVAQQQEAKQKQKQKQRNFLSYLKEQETSFGGKVGDLPMSMQKAIAKQYSKSERANLMNQADKEKMNKDGNK